LAVLGLLAGHWWFSVHLLRQNGRLLVRLDALETRLAAGGVAPPQNGGRPAAVLPAGTPAPAFELSGLHGETLTLDSLRAPGEPVMLLFTDPNCGPCDALLPEIRRWQQEHAGKLGVSLISRGTVEENRAKSSEHGLTNVLLQEDREVSEAYRAFGTPSAVLVSPDGAIDSPLAAGTVAIRELVTQAVEAPTPRAPLLPGAPGPTAVPNSGGCPKCGKGHTATPARPAARKVGEPAPPLELPDLAGKSVDLIDLRGSETLVLFWNPGCGFCQKMLPDLKEWEANPPKGAPRLLVVSVGTEEANREMGLNSPMVLDQQFVVGRAFRAGGTPSAVLVDAESKVASGVVVGAPAVLELAGAGRSAA